MEILEQVFSVGFLAATIRIATPLLFATMGEMAAERAGVLNLGIEGIMLFGAMTGFTAAYFTGELWIGVAVAALTGMAFGALMGLLTVTLGLSQHVSGLGVTLLCTGFTFFFYRLVFGQPSQPPNIEAFRRVPIPLLSDIPFLGPALFNHVALVYAAYVLVPLAAFVLYRTPWGLALRTVGENPRAAISAGVSVAWTRFRALVLSGMLMGIGGVYLSIAQFNAFTFGVVSGRGWVCIALVVLGQWDPRRCALAVLLFAAVDALQLRLQSSGAIDVPYQMFLMLPFLVTIVAMAIFSRRARAPAALLIPFRREER